MSTEQKTKQINERTYDLKGLTRKQVETLMVASEVLSRLTMGQLDDALDMLPTVPVNERDWETYHDDMKQVESILRKHFLPSIRNNNAYLGIHSSDIHPQGQIAFDLYQVMRHRLAWDRAIEEGVIKPGEPRKWPEMIQVIYDEPHLSSSEPLPVFEAK
jgi:hypothetical protein